MPGETTEKVQLETSIGEIIAVRDAHGMVHDSRFIDPTTGKVVALGEKGDLTIAQYLQAASIEEGARVEALKLNDFLNGMPPAVKALAVNEHDNPGLAPYRQELDVALKTSDDMRQREFSLKFALEQMAKKGLAAQEEGHGLSQSTTIAYVTLPALNQGPKKGGTGLG